MSEPHRILVTDDDPVVRAAYRSFFAQQQEFVVCGEARTGAEGVQAYGELLPDVVLMDLQMPVLSGIEATRQIRQRWPDACVVVITTFGTNDYVVAALRAGAAGYLLKDTAGKALVAALRQALAGDMPLSGAVRRELVASVVDDRPAASTEPLAAEPTVLVTEREQAVLVGLAQGLTNHQIGTRLFVSEGSVKQHLVSIGRKLGTTSRTGILIQAIQLDLIDPYAIPPSEA